VIEELSAESARPAGRREVAPQARKAHAATTRPTAAVSIPAERAEASLATAKNYIVMDKPDIARPRLQEIIKRFPGTPAAQEAYEILGDLLTK
jgi:hypothetical protein